MAMILDPFMSKLSKFLKQMEEESMDMQLGIPGQSKKLGETIRNIQCDLADAERKQTESSAIELWLKQLKDVLYDADVVIDLCIIKAKECFDDISSRPSSNACYGCPLLSCFCNLVYSHDEIGFKIKDINSKLEAIAKRKTDLGLTESQIFPGTFDRISQVDPIIPRKIDPSIELADIVGEKIEEDTEELVKWLIKEEKDVTDVAVIVGIEGKGIWKTPLAKRIFNDPAIKEGFHLKLWVCVSKEVKGAEVLLKCLIREVGSEHSVAQEISDLVPFLKRLVQGKKFLVVLDDVWEESRAVWDNVLHATMSGGARGSVLLVTTEDEKVVVGMRATKLHWVDEKTLEEDTKQLVKWLIKEEKDVTHVAAIVGMGGIGKTTLAKMIFNNPAIKEGFHLKLWVCVSKEVKRADVLLKCLILEAGGEHSAAQEESDLVPLLMRLIQGKKFLLVLDDVWEESQAVWDDVLRAPMSGGARGSRLLVTTRDERVAIGMKTTKLHRVEKLSHEDGWSLLIKQVFQNEMESEIQELKDIGLQLVKKCDGLPLAIKSIGDVLSEKRKTRSEWQEVLNNIWFKDGLPEEVYLALYLSYEDLSPPLKQCFIFCSLFPKGLSHHKIDLIYMWLAEGFLQNCRDFWSLGNAYYTELQLRNLLEDDSSYYVDRKESRYKMHNLLWVIARHLGKDDNCVLLEGSNAKTEGSQKVRRLSIEGNEVNTRVIKKEKGLRTLLLRGKPEIPHDDLCKAWSNLRILDLSESNISRIPDSLCDLVHLRYLDVSDSGINELPNSIGNLKYLLYLNLEYCTNLSHVPRSIINLQELRFLNTHNSRVKAIPAGLKRLYKLVHLYGFRPYEDINEEGFSSLIELAYLPKLVILHLERLEEVSDVNIANLANLHSKDHLQDLYLMYTYLNLEEQLLKSNEKKKITEDVLNELCPPYSLERFVIKGYIGRCLPNWLDSIEHLRYLVIENCVCFERLESLGKLVNLECLRIINAYSVVNIGEEFVCTTRNIDFRTAFPQLGELHFEDMPNWKEWQWNKGLPAMPNLKKIFIQNCPHLRSLPEGLFHHATSMEYLFIGGINILKSFGNIEVQTMELVNYEIETLPECLTTIMPQKLKIYCTERLLLKIVSQAECGSDWNRFNHIPKVTIRSRSSYATYQKTPFSFTTNITTSSGQR